MKVKCTYCGNDYNNVGAHERFCKLNPANVKPDNTGLIQSEGKLKPILELQSQGQDATTKSLSQNSSDSAVSPKHESNTDQMNAPVTSPLAPIIITDVQDYNGTVMSAWFEVDGKHHALKPIKCGTLIDEYQQIPTVLVISSNGMLLPPFMIPGFIGMLPEDHEFLDDTPSGSTEPEKLDETEPFPPFPEPELEPEPTKEETQDVPATPIPIIAQNDIAKPSLTTLAGPHEKQRKGWWPFRKKKQIPELSTEAKDLLKQLKEATI